MAVKSVKTTKVSKTVKATKTVKAAKVAKVAKTAKAVKTVKVAKTVKAAKAVKAAKTVKAAKAVKAVKSVKVLKTSTAADVMKDLEMLIASERVQAAETATDAKVKNKIDDAMLIAAARACRDMISEKKAEKVTLLDLRGVSSYLDYFLIATGTSQAHLRSLAKESERFLSQQGLRSRGVSDLSSEWIILDYSEIIVHLFTEEARSYYDLDKLWSDAVPL